LKIELKHRRNFFIYDKNNSAFVNEEEVILQEGLKFEIMEKKLLKKMKIGNL